MTPWIEIESAVFDATVTEYLNEDLTPLAQRCSAAVDAMLAEVGQRGADWFEEPDGGYLMGFAPADLSEVDFIPWSDAITKAMTLVTEDLGWPGLEIPSS